MKISFCYKRTFCKALFLVILLSWVSLDATLSKNLADTKTSEEIVPVDSILVKSAKESDDKATTLWKKQKYKESLIYMRQALELYMQVSDTVKIAFMYRDIADGMRITNGDADEIISNYQKASDLCHAIGLYDDELSCLIAIKKQLLQKGRNEEYAQLSQQIIQRLATMTPSFSLYRLMGDEQYGNQNFGEAIPYYYKAKDLYEQEGNKNDFNNYYYDVCVRLATSCFLEKRYEEAISLTTKNIELIDKHNSGNDAMSIYSHTLILIKSYLNLGETEKAVECVEMAKQKLVDFSDAFSRYIPYELMEQLCFLTSDWTGVLTYATKADSILSEEYDDIHDYRLQLLVDRINALSWLDRYKEAVTLSRYNMQIKQPIYQNSQDEYKADLLRLANMEAFSGYYEYRPDMDSAKIHMAEYAKIEEDEIKSQAPWLTATQRNAFWNKAQRTLLSITGFATQLGVVKEPFVEDVYNAHILASGLLLQTEKTLSDIIYQRGSDEDRLALNQLVALRDTLTDVEGNQDIERQADLKIRIQALENYLLLHSAELANYSDYLNRDFKSIHSVLKRGEVLVDFLEIQHTENKDKSLTAFIIRPEWEHPRLMRVCRYSELFEITESLNAKLYEDSISCAFRQTVLDSVLYYVQPGERLYYVPDGILHNVALENLLTDDDRLLSEVYEIRRLSSAREIEKVYSPKVKEYKKAVLYGALDYGSYNLSEFEPANHTGSPDYEERGMGDAYEALRTTEYEIKTINSILEQSHIHTTCHRAKQGTEESFRALDGNSPEIIHLATHGYFLTQDQALKVKGLSGKSDAMHLAGLVMAGGNAGWLNIPTENGALDGLLSAQDIAELDLSKTKLVVLSACKTGSGELKTDGIFGLQRAFKKAGASSLLMTLWNVNDRVTALFMSDFYQELVKNKWDKYKAFANAKKHIKQQYPEPYYWAGFILLD